MSRWFRFYSEALNDPKVQRLDGDTFKAWVNILCLASNNEGRIPPLSDLAFALRVDAKAAQTLLDSLFDASLLDRIKTGTSYRYAPHGWVERQYKSDTSTERVKRFRKRTKAVTETPPETEADNRIRTEKKDAIASCIRRAFPVSDAQGVWNTNAAEAGWPTVLAASGTRSDHTRNRLREHGLDGFTAAIARARASPYLGGSDPPTWFTFDWIIKPANFQKLIEGNYDRRHSSDSPDPTLVALSSFGSTGTGG